MARLSRQSRRRREKKNQFLLTKEETTRLSRPRQRRRDFPDNRGDGAIKNQFLATKAETALLSGPGRRRRDQDYKPRVEVNTLRFSRPGWRRHDFPDQGGDGAIFRQRQRRCNQELILCQRVGCGATLAIRVETAQTKADAARLSRPRPRRRFFPDEDGDMRPRINSSRPRWRRREILYQSVCSKLINSQNRVRFFSYPTLLFIIFFVSFLVIYNKVHFPEVF